jgi:cobalt-precorrin 5A hydrolase
MIAERKPYAIYAITRHGLEIARRLIANLPESDLFVSERLAEVAQKEAGLNGFKPMALPMGPTLSDTFTSYDCHVFIISVGAVVRMIAPLMKDKKVDPAVVCVDDAARFSICVLSGHVGRGNAFTDLVANSLNAQAVITTASDSIGTLTVDILGRELGWVLDDPNRNVTRGCAAIVNASPVMFVQEAGEPDWWPLSKALPPGVSYCDSLDHVDPTSFEMLLIATDREIREAKPSHWDKAVIYRPRTLVLGIGCDRGTAPGMLERGVRWLLARHHLSIKSVKAIASIDKKSDEVAIIELARTLGCPLLFYKAEELDAVQGIENPSATVKKFVGTRGVAEPAALMAAGASVLLVPKQTYTEPGAGRTMTMAVARASFPSRNAEAIRA